MKGNKKRALRRSLFFFFLFPISPAPKSKCCNNNNSKGSASKLQRCLNKLLTAAWASFRYPSSLSHLAHLSLFFFFCVLTPKLSACLGEKQQCSSKIAFHLALVNSSLPFFVSLSFTCFLRIAAVLFFFFWLVFCFATELKESDSVCVQLSLLSLDTDLILPHFSIAINKVISHYLFQFCNNHLLLLIFFLLPHHLFFLSGILTTFYFYVFFF